MADYTSVRRTDSRRTTAAASNEKVLRLPVEAAGGGGAVTTYVQRVRDTALNRWCYYSGTTPDPAPSPASTNPNHSGFIASHQIVGEV